MARLAGATTLFGCITNTLQSMPNGRAGNHRTLTSIHVHTGFADARAGVCGRHKNENKFWHDC